jgi:hypothetical protein
MVYHILEDGSLINNKQLEEKLMLKYRPYYNQITLMEPEKTNEEYIEECYVEHNKQIGYINEEG